MFRKRENRLQYDLKITSDGKANKSQKKPFQT